jgi:pimeloyl-ACP methyl ester carboxylesterase
MTTATPTTTVTTPDGRSLDLYLAGPVDGDVLLFHSGTPSAPLPYGPSIELMAERGLRYVAFCRAGYGSSTRQPGRSVADVVDDARAVLDHVGAERAVTVGWSGGGPHALACGALLGDRIRAVATLASVAPYPAAGLDYLAGMGDENIEEFSAALESAEALIAFKERNWPIFRAVTGDDVAEALGDLIDDVDRGSLTGGFADWAAASFREALRESYWGWFDDDMAFVRPWGFDVASIRVPVHVWQGRHDRMVPFAHGEWLAAHVPTATPHLFDELGHLTIAVDSMGSILDELVATGGLASRSAAAPTAPSRTA